MSLIYRLQNEKQDLMQRIAASSDVPPSYKQALQTAVKHIDKTIFAARTADMILAGGTDVPEELR